MRLIDADALINEIKKETEKAIEQDDKVGSFWLGYIAGLVIKQPTIQSALDSETLIRTIETGITATNSSDVYSLGMRNGMRWCKALLDGKEPKFEHAKQYAQPEPHEGHWIGKYPTTYICSECGWLIPDSKVKVFAYCPNCGAKMKGERQK